MNERIVWKGVGLVSGVAAGIVTRKLLVVVWRRVEGTEPPTNPLSSRTTVPEALAWAAASALAVTVARKVARRGAAEAWKAATGSYPEGVEGLASSTA